LKAVWGEAECLVSNLTHFQTNTLFRQRGNNISQQET
jgi:hypothetical protein